MNNTHHILLQMDTILDTFLACVEKANPEWKSILLSNKKYTKRISNNLSFYHPEINYKQVQEVWEKRDKEILQMSNVSSLLCRFYMNRCTTYLADEDAPGYTDVAVTLNIYPYELDNEEIQVFREMLAGYFYTTNISVISRSVRKMTPNWIRSQFQQVVIYDFNEWAGIHIERLRECSLEKVLFTFPVMLLPDITPVGKSVQEIVHALRLSFLGVLQTDIIPLEDMSIFSAEELKK